MKFCRPLVSSACLFLVAAAALAQPQPARDANALLSGSAAVKATFAAGAKRAEERLIPMVLQRGDSTGDARVRLEAQLDMEVLSRWVAAIKPASDDHAAALYLRLGQLSAAGAALQERFIAAGNQPLNRIQQNAAKQLHQLTFDLPASADVAKLDEVCRNVGIYALELASGEVTNPSQVPAMRPGRLPPAPDDQPPTAVRRPTGASRSEPSRLIPYLKVSGPLRQQLSAMLDMVERPAGYGLTEQDVSQLRPVLHDAIDIAAGLSGNAGVSAENRVELERQLTESLALFSDRRLRDLGKQRINEMGEYRQVLGSISRLQLTEGNYKLLAPAFEYAQKTPAASKQVLGAVERFVGYCTLFDKSPATVSYAANPMLAKSIQRPYDDSRKSFETSRSAFLGAVEGLGGGDIAGSEPGDLDLRLDEMRIALDLIDALQAMPEALDTLNAFKPKPPGGIDRRIAKEASVAASPGKGPIRQEAANVIKDLVRVAETARELEKLRIEGNELAVFTAYTKQTPDAIYAKWRSNVTEIASQAASGVPIDAGRIERNEGLVPLVQSLTGVVQVEATLQQTAQLDRWADWGVDAKAVEQVLFPYRAAAAGAFAGFLADNTESMRAWPEAQKARRPIMRFMMRSVAGAALLPELPTPMHLQCAKLMTPLANPTYANQRYFSLANVALSDADAAVAEQIRKALAVRLRNE